VEAISLNGQDILFALKENDIHRYSKPEDLYFFLIAPSSLQLCQPFDHFAKLYKTSIDRNGPIASGFQPLIFYR
jgi:hypothetical protein